MYSNSPIGLPTEDCAKVVLREMGSITAPVTLSIGAPAWTARVPKRWTGEGARGGVSIGSAPGMVISGGSARRAVEVRKVRRFGTVRLTLRRREWGNARRFRLRRDTAGNVRVMLAIR